MFGDEGRARTLALLPEDSRAELERDVTTTLWFPSRHVIAWAFAIWEGPAGRDREVMSAFVRKQWDLSFGVVRRMMLHLASPTTIVPRLPKLWREDHNVGEVTSSLEDEGRGATVHFEGTPFVDTPHGRASMAEVYRHAFAQTRARNVTATHAADGPHGMVLRLRWTL